MPRSPIGPVVSRLGRLRQRALALCLTATLNGRGRTMSIHEYARATGISARMLIHYFGTKADLDREILRTVDQNLRAEAQELLKLLGGLGAVDALVKGFQSPASAGVRTLLRTLLARAFAADRTATALLLAERDRWVLLFERTSGSRRKGREIVARLLGAAIAALLDDLAAERAARRPAGRKR